MTQQNRNTVLIEQRFEEPARFLIFTMDDALVFALPFMVGWVTKHLIPGAIIGLVLYSIWKRMKGEGGLSRLKAATYWFLPSEVTPYRSFPPSHVEHWRG